MTKTTTIKEKDIERNWYLVDAAGVRLGQLASFIAGLIKGKKKVKFSPRLDCGDHVVVINSDNIDFHPKRGDRKIYWRHSGYPGALRKRTLKEMMDKDSREVIQKAVWGMLPKNKLGRKMVKRLHIYKDSDHQHEAQKPKKVEPNK